VDFNASNSSDANITYSQQNGDLNATLSFGGTQFVLSDVNNTQNSANYTTTYTANNLDQNGTPISSALVNVGDVIAIPNQGSVVVDAVTRPVDTEDTQQETSTLRVNVAEEIILDIPTNFDVNYTTDADPFGNPVVFPTGNISSADQMIEYIVVNGEQIDVNDMNFTFPDSVGFVGTTLTIDVKLEGKDELENFSS